MKSENLRTTTRRETLKVLGLGSASGLLGLFGNAPATAATYETPSLHVGQWSAGSWRRCEWETGGKVSHSRKTVEWMDTVKEERWYGYTALNHAHN